MNGKQYFIDFLNEYNGCWYNKDLEKLKTFYDSNNTLIYFDNHKGNDTYTVNEHLELLLDFFVNGKKTESGSIEPLIIDNLNVFHKDDTACLCYNVKYKSYPDPAMRCTLYLENIKGEWKIYHVHCSFEPEK